MESWRAVPGFAGYEVSDRGRVRSYRPRNGRGPLVVEPRVLKYGIDRDGYPKLTLRRGDRDVSVKVHQLMATAFGLIPEPGQDQVCHRNGDPADNRLENLRWGTARDNADDRGKHGRAANNFPIIRGERHPKTTLTTDQVHELRQLRADGASYAELGRWFGITGRSASNIVNRRTWAHV